MQNNEYLYDKYRNILILLHDNNIYKKYHPKQYDKLLNTLNRWMNQEELLTYK